MARKPCRHCKERPAFRSRGLCWRCYYAPAVKALYPAAPRRPELGTAPGPRPLPAAACPHGPGTPGRLATLAARAAAEEQLWHPGDVGLNNRRAG